MYKIGIFTKEEVWSFGTETKEYRTVTYIEEKPLEEIEKMVKRIFGNNSKFEILEKIK